MDVAAIRATWTRLDKDVGMFLNNAIGEVKSGEELAVVLDILGQLLVDAGGSTIGTRVHAGFLDAHGAAAAACHLHLELTEATARRKPRYSFDWKAFAAKVGK